MAPVTEVAWAAGFWDGEGCTSLTKTGYMSLSLNQKHIEPLERFQAAVDGLGKIYTVNTTARGIVYQWRCHDSVGRLVIPKLWPYLGQIKRDQAQRCLDGSVSRGQKRCDDETHEWGSNGKGHRLCLTCRRRRQNKYDKKRRAKACG